jgi:hypothetical protein
LAPLTVRTMGYSQQIQNVNARPKNFSIFLV